MGWQGSSKVGPVLLLQVSQHAECVGHTWYMIECCLTVDTPDHRREDFRWLAPRRIEQLRLGLHDKVKTSFGANYSTHFGNTPFARPLAPSGTTARLHEWFCSLANVINGRVATPYLAAFTLQFLQTPEIIVDQLYAGQEECPFQAGKVKCQCQC